MKNESKKRTPEELKKARHRDAQRKYMASLKKRANSGEKKALEQYNKNKYMRQFSLVKSFVQNEITKKDIEVVKKWLVDRLKELNKKA